MSYDNEFYQLYRAYLLEQRVRVNHDFVFEKFRKFVHPITPLVIDLGCGLGEYFRFGHYAQYAGIDVNNAGDVPNLILGDYHSPEVLRQISFSPNAFLSLFSIECCNPPKDRYEIYQRIFTELPSIQYGLASGFFYEKKRDAETVGEAGGIISYQSIESSADYIFSLFVEYRLHIHTPSQMFGDDVVEVWKIFERRS